MIEAYIIHTLHIMNKFFEKEEIETRNVNQTNPSFKMFDFVAH